MADGVRDEPWWASGSPPTDGLRDDEDPLARHTSARHGNGTGRGGAWWQDAVDALADAARGAGDARTRGDGRAEAPPHEHGGDGDVCRVCPLCVALRALDASRPEVVAHLSEALRQLSLAARSFVEEQVAATGGDDALHRVDLDDE